MADLTTRARELAARERKLYDQRTIPAVLEELADEVERLTTRLAQMEEALIWCSGSSDFADGGIAREGWLKLCQPLIQHVGKADKPCKEAANIAAQRDAAVLQATQAEERLRAVEAELHTMKTAGIIEVASRNNRVTEYMFHWEGRALDAEATIARIRAADRTSITVRTTEAAKMRKGQAI